MKYTSDYLELAPTLLAPTRFPWGSYLGQTVPGLKALQYNSLVCESWGKV